MSLTLVIKQMTSKESYKEFVDLLILSVKDTVFFKSSTLGGICGLSFEGKRPLMVVFYASIPK